jgi:hypothetical protein
VPWCSLRALCWRSYPTWAPPPAGCPRPHCWGLCQGLLCTHTLPCIEQFLGAAVPLLARLCSCSPALFKLWLRYTHASVVGAEGGGTGITTSPVNHEVCSSVNMLVHFNTGAAHLSPSWEEDAGIWHTDGLRKHIAAVVLYYFRSSPCLLSGDLEFVDHTCCCGCCTS